VTGKIPIQFMANKWDLKDQAEITEEDLIQATKAYDSPYFLTSAKTGENVETAFQNLAQRIASDKLAKREVA
jgi:GTPase SAR1 family protein